MYSQTLLTTSGRGSGAEPTTAASSFDGCKGLIRAGLTVLPDAPLPALADLPDVPSAGLAFLAELLFAGVELAFLGAVSFAAVGLCFVLLGIGVLLALVQMMDGAIRLLPLDQHCCLSSSKLPAHSRNRTAG